MELHSKVHEDSLERLNIHKLRNKGVKSQTYSRILAVLRSTSRQFVSNLVLSKMKIH